MTGNETRTWAVVVVLLLLLILHSVLQMRERRRVDRKLRQHWAVLLQLEAEATARRGGRPRSRADLESAPAVIEGGR